jgi:8-oxo-dGTP pyrophosphatase MutT (NUDIX family)
VLIQFGVIPVRRAADGTVEVMLITSRDTRRWVVPRGNPIVGKSPPESAAQEAFEEAGIVGPVEPEAVGSYSYEKRRRLGTALPALVHLFRMSVAEERDDWPEKGQRERRWFPVEEAAEAVDEAELGRLIRDMSRASSQK